MEHLNGKCSAVLLMIFAFPSMIRCDSNNETLNTFSAANGTTRIYPVHSFTFDSKPPTTTTTTSTTGMTILTVGQPDVNDITHGSNIDKTVAIAATTVNTDDRIVSGSGGSYSVVENVLENQTDPLTTDSKVAESLSQRAIITNDFVPTKIQAKLKFKLEPVTSVSRTSDNNNNRKHNNNNNNNDNSNNNKLNNNNSNGNTDNIFITNDTDHSTGGLFKAPEFDSSKPFVPSFRISAAPQFDSLSSFDGSSLPNGGSDRERFSEPVKFERFYHPDHLFVQQKQKQQPFLGDKVDSRLSTINNNNNNRLSPIGGFDMKTDYVKNSISMKTGGSPDVKSNNNRVYSLSDYRNHPDVDYFSLTKDDNKPQLNGLTTGDAYNNFVHNDWLQQSDDTRNKFHNVKPSLKPKKKTAIMHVLSTLIPLMLLLAAIPPNIVVLNSTDPHRKIPATRSETSADELLRKSPITYLVEHLDAIPSDEEDCNKIYLCQQALKGSENDATFSQYSIWLLLSRGMKMAQEKLNLSDVVNAIRNKDCETSFNRCNGKPIVKKATATEEPFFEDLMMEDNINVQQSRRP